MRIIGVNISHDTSVSELQDGKILNLYESFVVFILKTFDKKPTKQICKDLKIDDKLNIINEKLDLLLNSKS